MMVEPESIRNRVEESGLHTLDLDQLLPNPGALKQLDIADYLEGGLILREKPFRQALNDLAADNWKDAKVALFCSSEAIIPDWAWMLATAKLMECGAEVHIALPDELPYILLVQAVNEIPLADYTNSKLVIKGCSKGTNAKALSAAIQRLQPVVQSIFYGEPCSTVPIYKRPKS